jgi:hypothetical protein
MAFIQRIQRAGYPHECQGDPDDCAVIDCITTEAVTHHETGAVITKAGAVVWHSCWPAAIHPEHRLNQDHAGEDHRGSAPAPASWTPPCEACLAHPAGAVFGP